MLTAYFQGLGAGAGLIIAIGAQNAFVLSHGIRRSHLLTITLICSLCDAILIMAGVCGVGSIVASNPALTRIAALGGAIFLFAYGLKAFHSAFCGDVLKAEKDGKSSWARVVVATLAVTLLNPHVYLDTIVLLGSISGRFADDGRFIFGVGAATASFLWFFLLSYGGRLLAPAFGRPMTWRVLDMSVGLVMWSIAASLAVSLFG
ncbi:MAG: amino acid transporter [Deltaproteobacteria bacterium]|nr:amino acid transporter [Deltaproteobacteria bacterium]